MLGLLTDRKSTVADAPRVVLMSVVHALVTKDVMADTANVTDPLSAVTTMMPHVNSKSVSMCVCLYVCVRKGKEAYLYSAFYILCISQSAQAWITQFYLQIHHACLSFVCVHQMAPPLTEVRDI